MRVLRATFVPIILALAAPRARAQRPVDWKALGDETVRMAAEYFRINTTIPPGNELAAAKWLKQVLDREGIAAQILDSAELGPNRANFYARLKGSGARRAIALVHHMDVVPADPRYWTVDAFSGTIKDGYLWGRGALDMKGNGIAQLMTMIAIKRSGLPLTRDIVFIGNAGEEESGDGAKLFTEKHADLLKDVEYLLTEGGGGEIDDQGRVSYGIGVAEKRPLGQTLLVHGVPSHGSRPTKQNPVPRLVEALHRVNGYETPIRVLPAVDAYFKAIAKQYAGEQRVWLSDVKKALADPKGRAWMLADPGRNALLRNTISLTMLQGSNKSNVIPAEASAYLDIRVLPDQDPQAFVDELTRVVADTAVHLSGVPKQMRLPVNAPLNTDLYRAIEKVALERDPGAVVAPSILTGATDRGFYQRLGIATYGFAPFKTPDAEARRGVHGNDERISVESFGFGVKFLYDVLRAVQ